MTEAVNDAYVDLTLRGGYRAASGWSVIAYVENVTDEVSYDGVAEGGATSAGALLRSEPSAHGRRADELGLLTSGFGRGRRLAGEHARDVPVAHPLAAEVDLQRQRVAASLKLYISRTVIGWLLVTMISRCVFPARRR